MKRTALAFSLSLFLSALSPAAWGVAPSNVPGFLDDQIRVNESAGSVVLRVARDSSAGRYVVNYQTRDAEARAGSDYQQTSGQLIFEDGDAGPKSIQIPILNDKTEEEVETFLVFLRTDSGNIVGVIDVEIVSEETPDESNDDEPGGSRGQGDTGSTPEAASGAGQDEGSRGTVPSQSVQTTPAGAPSSDSSGAALGLIVLEGPGRTDSDSRAGSARAGSAGDRSAVPLNAAADKVDTSRTLKYIAVAVLVLPLLALALRLRLKSA